jgi:hypothetical protein
MNDQTSLPAGASSPELSSTNTEDLRQQRRTIFIIGLVVFIFLALLITGLVFLLIPTLTTADTVSRIRDVFIIVMALESLLIGAILVILIFQIARLTNLLQHEIKPILKSTNETISTLRGTTEFLSDNLTEPVIKINEYVAAIQKFLELFGVGRRTP